MLWVKGSRTDLHSIVLLSMFPFDVCILVIGLWGRWSHYKRYITTMVCRWHTLCSRRLRSEIISLTPYFLIGIGECKVLKIPEAMGVTQEDTNLSFTQTFPKFQMFSGHCNLALSSYKYSDPPFHRSVKGIDLLLGLSLWRQTCRHICAIYLTFTS